MSDDVISRRAAIEVLQAAIEDSWEADYATDRMNELQSAQPERKEGRWVRKSTWMWTCSCCGKDNTYAYVADDAGEPTVLQDFFCPNCGAKMGGNRNE